MRLIRSILIALFIVTALCLTLALAFPNAAKAWLGDFFDGDASGQAVYEDMAIHPQAVRMGDVVYVAYQGANLDPYLVAFPDNGGVEGPYRIGTNPLVSPFTAIDSHGAPSLLADRERGVLTVFWGAHGTRLMKGRAYVSDLTSWTVSAWAPTNSDSLASAITYPQVLSDEDGTAHLFFRRDAGDVGDAAPRGSWLHASSVDGGATWSLESTPVVVGSDEVSWYAHFEAGEAGRIHLVMTALIRGGSTYDRTGVYYLRRDAADGVWTDAAGTSLDTTGVAGVERFELEATGTVSVVAPPAAAPGPAGPFHNQVTCADDGTGGAGLLFLTGEGGYGPNSQQWKFSRFTGSEWTSATVATTDHFMDASTIEYGPDGIDAFIVAGGTTGQGNWADPYRDRGGDIQWYHSTDGGSRWDWQRALASSDPGLGVIYNDPQIVLGHDAVPDGPRLLFGEWNNDAGNFVHKVYLWGQSGFRGKEFFPDITRLAGSSRYESAVRVSRQSFGKGSDYVVVASGEAFPDALVGATLADAYNAPLLLVSSTSVPTKEIERLHAKTVFVLGGEKTIAKATLQKLKVRGVKTVKRIGGADRFATAANVAHEVADKKGRVSGRAYVVSGESFPDALSVAPLAASQGAPLLLVARGSVPLATTQALRSLSITATVIVGGESVVDAQVASSLPASVRVAGLDRYATSSALAEVALVGDPERGLSPALRMDRFVIASGETFPDALAGSAFAARIRGPVLLTQGLQLPAATQDLLTRRAYRVLHSYVVGGERAVSAMTMSQVADLLRERQDD